MWSLGVILVNLTCGRNPWKRASMDDSTFRAYRNNPRFLSSILPLSLELDFILSRIFEHDPIRRIRIPELRDLILRCKSFTTRSNRPPNPTRPSESQCIPAPEATLHTLVQSLPGFDQCPPSERTAAPLLAAYPVMSQCSASSGGSDRESIFSAASSCSSTSSCDSHESDAKFLDSIAYTLPRQTRDLIPSCSYASSGSLTVQPCILAIAAN